MAIAAPTPIATTDPYDTGSNAVGITVHPHATLTLPPQGIPTNGTGTVPIPNHGTTSGTLPQNPADIAALTSGPSMRNVALSGGSAGGQMTVPAISPDAGGTTGAAYSQAKAPRSTEVAFINTPAGDAGAATVSSSPSTSPAQPVTAQEALRDVANVTSPHQVQRPLTPYTLQAGGYLPAVLAANVNSDFCGDPGAIVASDVYDSISERHLLVPGGSRLLGACKNAVIFGQNRIFIVWNRLFFPDGSWVALDEQPGVDQQGSTGVNADVNRHTGNLIGGALLLSLLEAGVSLANPPQQTSSTVTTPSVSQTVAQSIANSITQLAVPISQQALSQAPTLQITAGERFRIEVLQDLVFRHPYEARTSEATP
ncbi:TrbI/VirB10 family protein [bacterium]|nr:MAG: TrbI/VirB10 family protein [bacterium]